MDCSHVVIPGCSPNLMPLHAPIAPLLRLRTLLVSLFCSPHNNPSLQQYFVILVYFVILCEFLRQLRCALWCACSTPLG